MSQDITPENAWLIADDARIVDGVVHITAEALNEIMNTLRAEGAPAAEGAAHAALRWIYKNGFRHSSECPASVNDAFNQAFADERAALSPPAAEGKEDVRSVRQWLLGLHGLDMDEIAADGGITVGMVVQQEAVEMARRLARYLSHTPAPAAEPVEGILVGLDSIRRQADYWVKYDTEARAREGLTSDDDTHLISPPRWPSHGQLKAWSATLTKAGVALSKLSGYPLVEGGYSPDLDDINGRLA